MTRIDPFFPPWLDDEPRWVQRVAVIIAAVEFVGLFLLFMLAR